MRKYVSIAIVAILLIAFAWYVALRIPTRLSGTSSGGADVLVPSEGLPKAINAIFLCSGSKTISAEFVTGKVALHLSDGRWLELPEAMSASGARYASPGDTIVFWNKGNTAFITEKGATTYEGCVTGS